MKLLQLACLSLLSFSLTAESWQINPDMPTARQEIYADRGNGHIYVPGGIGPDGTSTLDTFEAYDAARGRWHQLAPLPEPRHHITPSVIGDRVYAIGGFQGPFPDWIIKADTFVYDTTSNSWQKGTPLPEPQAEHVAAVVDERIHIIGGRIQDKSGRNHFDAFLDTTLHNIYDPVNDTWTRGKPAPTARNSAGAAVIDGLIYVVGGRNNVIQEDGTQLQQNLGSLEVYDPKTDSWQTRTPMPEGLGGTAAAAVNGKLYVVGGEQWAPEKKVFASAWVYDPATDAWARVSDMPTARHGLAAAEADGKLVTIGGGAKVGGGGAGGFTETLTP